MSSSNACPQCGYLMDAFDAQCPRCKGKGLSAPPAPAASPAAAPAAVPTVPPTTPSAGSHPSSGSGPTRYCLSCRNRISTLEVRCPHCGQAAPHVATRQSFSLEAQRQWVGYGLCGVLALVAAGAGWGWMQYGGRIKHAMVGQSDIQYTVETRLAVEGSPSTQPYSLSTYWFKHGAMRVDTEMLQGPLRRTLSTIALCPKRKLYVLDESLGIYTAEPLPLRFQVEDGDNVGRVPEAQAMVDAECCQDSGPLLRAKQNGQAKPAYRLAQYDSTTQGTVRGAAGARKGKVTRSYVIEDLGRDTIADVPTVHYRLTVRVKSTGCAGTSEKTERSEVWVAPSIYNKFSCALPTPTPTSTPEASPSAAPTSAPAQPTAVPPTPIPVPTPYVVPTPLVVATPLPRVTPPPEDACDISYEQQGNIADFSQAFRGLAMRLRVYEGSRIVMEQEVTQLSQKQLFGDQFSVRDHRQVSELAFEEAQQKQLLDILERQSKSERSSE